MPARKKSKPVFYLKSVLILLFLVFVGGVTLYMSNNLIARRQNFGAGAAAGNAQLFFQPDTLALPPDTPVNIWVTSDKAVAFVRAEFTFDRSKIKLTQEVTLSNPVLTRQATVTPMSEANSTGRIVIALGLDPSFRDNPPLGTFQLAALKLSALTTAGSTSLLNFNTTSSQIVDTGAVPFTLSAASASLALNVSPSPAASSPPTSADTILPTAAFLSPANGAAVERNKKLTLHAEATDNVAVSKVVFIAAGKTLCSDTSAPYTCSWTPKGRSGASVSLSAKAYDSSGNQASQTISVTLR